MRQLIVSVFMSLDGVMEAPGGEPGYAHTGWAGDLLGPEEIRYKLDEIEAAETLLVGRVTYESFAGAWPDRDGPMADKLNGMPKVVVSATLREPAWNNTSVLAPGDLVTGVRDLRAGEGGPILVHGSRTLVQALLGHGLVDELRLMVFPVVLSSGDRVFADRPDKLPLELDDCRIFRSGITAQHYRPAA